MSEQSLETTEQEVKQDKEAMVLTYWAEKTAEEAKKKEQYETHAEHLRAIKEAQHNIHTLDSSSTPDTLTSDSGALAYNDFK